MTNLEETAMRAWAVHDAKARFSELLETSLAEGPQVVTRHGKATAVLVPLSQWEALQSGGQRDLKQLLLGATAPTNLAVSPRGGLRLRRV